MTTALPDILDQAIAIRQGDIIIFKAAHPLSQQEFDHVAEVIKERLDPLGIQWMVTSDFEVTVMRPEDE